MTLRSATVAWVCAIALLGCGDSNSKPPQTPAHREAADGTPRGGRDVDTAGMPATRKTAGGASLGRRPPRTAPTPVDRPGAVIETNKGTIEVELWPDRAPHTAKNFLRYVDDGFYDGLIFHRVVPGFMIQGGGFNSDLQEKPTRAPIPNEASAANPNLRGTLAMARTGEPHSATSQFYINLAANSGLDHRAPTKEGYGYCVFGRVTRGMDVVDAIAKVKTVNVGVHNHVPVSDVVIRSIRRKK